MTHQQLPGVNNIVEFNPDPFKGLTELLAASPEDDDDDDDN